MRINHHIGINFDDCQKESFARVGVDLSAYVTHENSTMAVFDIFEDDPRFPEIDPLVRRFEALHLRWSVFTEAELDAARFLSLNKCWENGYPQPEDDYDSITYDNKSFCGLCGTGLKQLAPFRLTGEPKWGRRSLFRLNWVPDEIFTTPDAWSKVFKPFGIECMPVLKNKTGKALETCVQLVLSDVVELDIPKDHPSEFCAVCGIRRWEIFQIGFFPGPLRETQSAMFKSAQYFGTGHASWKDVLVSQALYGEIEKHKLRGAEFAACA